MWTLLISLAMLQAARFPRALSYLGIATGAVGLLTVIPAVFMPAVAVYALGHCAWWIWLGGALAAQGFAGRGASAAGVGAGPQPSVRGALTEGDQEKE